MYFYLELLMRTLYQERGCGRSADLESAVSQVCNLPGSRTPDAPDNSQALQSATLRYPDSSGQVCATYLSCSKNEIPRRPKAVEFY